MFVRLQSFMVDSLKSLLNDRQNRQKSAIKRILYSFGECDKYEA